MPLSTNWIITAGKFFCVISGNDANAGTAASPKQNFLPANMSAGTTHIFRSGYYPVTGTVNLSSQYFYGEGFVILDGTNCIGNMFAGYNLMRITNFRVQNVKALDFIGIFRCSVKGFPGSAVVSGIWSNYSTFVNLTTLSFSFEWNNGNSITNNLTIINCTCTIGGSASYIYIINNSYFGGSVSIILGRRVTFTHCAFASGLLVFGTSINTWLNTAENVKTINGFQVTINGTAVVFNYCFWTTDPGFNNEAAEDFTLKISPQSILFNSGNIIGAYGLASVFNVSHTAFDASIVSNPAVYTNLSNSTVVYDNAYGTNLTITAGTNGTVETSTNLSYCFSFPFMTTVSAQVQFFGTFDYGIAAPGKEIIDTVVNTSGTEVRMTYEIKFYDEVTTLWSSYYNMEIFTPIQQNVNLGNGNVDTVMTALKSMSFKRFALKLTLRNNGV